MHKVKTILPLIICLSATVLFSQDDILWGDAVPENWNGTWPEEMRTACEKADFAHTATNQDILEYFAMLRWNSENVHIINAFISDRGRTCPVLVLSNPRVTSAKEAKESGKAIVYLQGGIHPDECEGKEALLMIIRDILFGEKKYLLDNLIIMICPNLNVDGNETRVVNFDLPKLTGIRHNALGYDLNRDALKVESTNLQGIYKNVYNDWDPVLVYDTHRMGSPRHGYAIVYAGANVATAHSGPRDYVTNKMFPEIRRTVRENGKIETFFHAGLDNDWPPTEFSHDRAYWTAEGKFMASSYALRNRMAIIVETPGSESFERMIYASYVFTNELLEYCHKHGKEMKEVCQKAEEEVVESIRSNAATGELKNFVEGEYVSAGKADVLAYKSVKREYVEGTSIRRRNPEELATPPELIPNVDLLIKTVGTKEATVPRGYLIPADLGHIVDKLRIMNVKVVVLDKPVKASGEEFLINKLYYTKGGFAGYDMTRLDGVFARAESKELPAGTFLVDMAQPLANVIFYCLEPEIGDGFLGWNLLDDYLKASGVNERSIVYPIYKYFEINDVE